EGYGAGRVWENLGPLAECLVRAEHDGPVHVVAARDHLEEKVGVAVAVREVADFVDAQQLGRRVPAQSPSERGRALLGSEVGEHVAGAGDAHRVALDQGMVCEVLEDHALAHSVGADEDGVDAIVQKAESKQLLDALALDLARPGPVEIDDGLERADTRVTKATSKTAALPLGFLDV